MLLPNSRVVKYCSCVWIGDALGIYPENNPPEVVEVLNAVKLDGTEIVYVEHPAFQGTLLWSWVYIYVYICTTRLLRYILPALVFKDYIFW